ncbi:MAG: hypothetical protein WC391_09170 [Methanoregula sp.]|jgi:hypothetical protein
MQKDKNRFTATGGEIIGKATPTNAQKKSAKKVAAYLRSLPEEDKSCSVIVSQ